jgi:CheY-like chemotaxis protein
MKKILIIEDDKIVANIYGNKFRNEGFHVEFAVDGLSGLEMVSRVEPDLVMLDLMLPKLSGVEVIKGVRAQDKFRNLPIVVFSNSYLSNLVQEAWQAGATKCLSKADSTPKHLIDVIKGIFTSPPASASPRAVSATAPPPPPPAAQVTQASFRAPYSPITQPAPAPAFVPPLSVPASLGAMSGSESTDAAFQAELRKNYLETASFSFREIRTLLQLFSKSEDEISRLSRLFELYRKVGGIASNAGVVGLASIANLGSTLEQLMKELHDKPASINASTLRTMSHALDLLGTVLEQRRDLDEAMSIPCHVLVVDDDMISRRAVIYALEKANLRNTGVEDPGIALKVLSVSHFDLVFLDVDMPGMSGYELCSKLRTIPSHEKTPVIFVTGLQDFSAQARSAASGGNDFITKPFLFLELSVKALTYVMRARLSIY